MQKRQPPFAVRLSLFARSYCDKLRANDEQRSTISDSSLILGHRRLTLFPLSPYDERAPY